MAPGMVRRDAVDDDDRCRADAPTSIAMAQIRPSRRVVEMARRQNAGPMGPAFWLCVCVF